MSVCLTRTGTAGFCCGLPTARKDGDSPQPCGTAWTSSASSWPLSAARAWFRQHGEQKRKQAPEEELRAGAVRSALSWLGTPYRWGGKSAAGIDCSGLAFMSWMENGLLIWRDASILPDYPLSPVDRSRLEAGDLIFFPGHVAVYIGNSRYIHATAYRNTPRVTVNSLDPDDPEYRRDLAESITACGSLFG